MRKHVQTHSMLLSEPPTIQCILYDHSHTPRLRCRSHAHWHVKGIQSSWVMLDGERASLIEGGATHTQHTVDPEGRVLWDGNNAIASVVMTANAPRAKASVTTRADATHHDAKSTRSPPTLHRWTTYVPNPSFLFSVVCLFHVLAFCTGSFDGVRCWLG